MVIPDISDSCELEFGAKEAEEIASSIGVKPSSYFRRNILDPLLEKGYLEQFGEKKPFLYRTNPDIIGRDGTGKQLQT